MNRNFPYLARKIKRSKWMPPDFASTSEIRADAVAGGCIKTQNNSLSVWQCNNTKDDVAEIVLAMASRVENLEKMDIILLPIKEFERLGFNFEETDGDTFVNDLKKRHLDMTQLTLRKIGLLSRRIAKNVRNEFNCFSLTKGEIIGILKKGIDEGRLRKEDLNEKLQSKLN